MRFLTSVFWVKLYPSNSWAKAASHIQYTFIFTELFYNENAQHSILLYCNGVSKIIYDCFLAILLLVQLLKKHKHWCFDSALSKKTMHSVTKLESRLRAMWHCTKFVCNIFFYDPPLCSTEWSQLSDRLHSMKSTYSALCNTECMVSRLCAKTI
jgi:hypothetical protein